MKRASRKTDDENQSGEGDSNLQESPSTSGESAGLAATHGEEQEENEEAKAWDTPPLNFPARLMQILQMDEPPEGIKWLPGGETFAIDIDKIEDVLVTHFQGAKWHSFTRTLNKWGFRKALGVEKPPNVAIYQNPYFKKSSPELVTQIINFSRPASRPATRKRKANRDGDDDSPATIEQLLLGGVSDDQPAARSQPNPALGAAANVAGGVANIPPATTPAPGAAAALGLGTIAGSTPSSSIPSFSSRRSEQALLPQHDMLERMMAPANTNIGLQRQLEGLGLPLGFAQQQQQTQANVRGQTFFGQHLGTTTADFGNRNASATATGAVDQQLRLLQSLTAQQRQQEQRIRLLQAQLSSEQPLEQQVLQQVHPSTLVAHLQRQNSILATHLQRQNSQHGRSSQPQSINLDALTRVVGVEQLLQQSRIGQLHQQQQQQQQELLARSNIFGGVLRRNEASQEDNAPEGKSDDPRQETEDEDAEQS